MAVLDMAPLVACYKMLVGGVPTKKPPLESIVFIVADIFSADNNWIQLCKYLQSVLLVCGETAGEQIGMLAWARKTNVGTPILMANSSNEHTSHFLSAMEMCSLVAFNLW